MGWLIALGALAILAVLPVGVDARYDGSGPLVRLLAGPVRLTLFPRPEKKSQKPKKERKKKGKAPVSSQPKEERTKDSSGGSWKDFLPLVKTGLAFLGDFRRKLRIDHLEFRLILAGEDPCDLAVNYGRAWAAVGGLLGVKEKTFVIKKRNVEVECDFTSPQTRVTARAEITISLGRLTVLAVRYGIRALKDFMTLRKIRKGGMNHE